MCVMVMVRVKWGCTLKGPKSAAGDADDVDCRAEHELRPPNTPELSLPPNTPCTFLKIDSYILLGHVVMAFADLGPRRTLKSLCSHIASFLPELLF